MTRARKGTSAVRMAAKPAAVARPRKAAPAVRAAKQAVVMGASVRPLQVVPARGRPPQRIELGDRDIHAIQSAIGQHRQAIKALRGSYRSSANPRNRLGLTGFSLSGDQQADAYSRRYARELARDLERNAGTCDTLNQVWTRLMVGDGVRTRAMSSSASWNELATAYMHKLYSKVRGGVDCRQKWSMYQLESILARSIFRDGDMGVLKLKNGQIQLFESEQIDGGDQAKVPGAEAIAGGVAYGATGETLGYFAAPYNVGRLGLGGALTGEARFYKPTDFLFSGIIARYSQTRGVPMLVSVLDDFERADSYVESEVIAAEIGSQIVGAVEYPEGRDPNVPRPAPSDEDPNGNGFDGGRNSDGTIDFQPTSAGSIAVMPDGTKYVPINPTRPNRDAEPFLIAVLRQFCAVAGLPYEIVFNDLRNLSWSTARSLVAAARDQIKYWQQLLLQPILSDLWTWHIARAIEAGKLPRIDDWAEHEHEWPVLAWPDPLKETQTQVAQVALGTTSLHRILGGNVWRRILDEQALEQQYRDQLFVQRVLAAAEAVAKAKAACPGLELDWSKVIASNASISNPAAYLDAVARADAASAAATKPDPGKVAAAGVSHGD